MSGKSTAAAKMAGILQNAEVISSAKIRLRGKAHSSTAAFVDETNPRTRKAKDWAYRKLCEKAEKMLLGGKIPILDATFHKRHRREWVYELAQKLGADVYIVWTVFGKSVDTIATRRSYEKKALHTTDQYDTMVSQTEQLSGLELEMKIIKFDRTANKIRLRNCGKDEFARKIAEAVTIYGAG